MTQVSVAAEERIGIGLAVSGFAHQSHRGGCALRMTVRPCAARPAWLLSSEDTPKQARVVEFSIDAEWHPRPRLTGVKLGVEAGMKHGAQRTSLG